MVFERVQRVRAQQRLHLRLGIVDGGGRIAFGTRVAHVDDGFPRFPPSPFRQDPSLRSHRSNPRSPRPVLLRLYEAAVLLRPQGEKSHQSEEPPVRVPGVSAAIMPPVGGWSVLTITFPPFVDSLLNPVDKSRLFSYFLCGANPKRTGAPALRRWLDS